MLVQTVLSLINLGSLRAGLVPGNESEADPQQLRQAIEAVRALLPQVEPVLGPDARQIRDAVSRLQMEYARLAGAGGAEVRRAARAARAPSRAAEAAPAGRPAAARAGGSGAGAEQRQALGSGALTPGRTASPPPSSIGCAAF